MPLYKNTTGISIHVPFDEYGPAIFPKRFSDTGLVTFGGEPIGIFSEEIFKQILGDLKEYREKFYSTQIQIIKNARLTNR